MRLRNIQEIYKIIFYQDSSSSEGESSTDDEYEDPKCLVCTKTPFQNQYDKPERFVKCTKCKNQGKINFYLQSI